ncbi:hypothetical protein HGG70_05165 [Rhodobacteraceae bacterium R_SAG4]|nr:hypothetical protein [Rhodobacteraceae bacterium R_SAG4]
MKLWILKQGWSAEGISDVTALPFLTEDAARREVVGELKTYLSDLQLAEPETAFGETEVEAWEEWVQLQMNILGSTMTYEWNLSLIEAK